MRRGLGLPPALLLALWATATPAAQAQPVPATETASAAEPGPAPPEPPRPGTSLRLGVVTAYNRYIEDAMSLNGPFVGVVADWPQPWGLTRWRAQAQVQVGTPDYSSPVSGNLSDRRVLKSVWRLGYVWPGPGADASAAEWETALEWHTYYNDLRGRTDTGSFGYERERYGIWASAGYSAPFAARNGSQQRWRTDAAVLLYGLNVSRLSQVSAAYSDATNVQRTGWALRGALQLRSAAGEFRPYVQVTRLEASDTQRFGILTVTEPANTSWELGMQWLWR